ncbi:MAG: hypothetical protein HKM95_00600 [Inquilinus sp.]|nr:hypothetical protein [Inquilinus sp.]
MFRSFALVGLCAALMTGSLPASAQGRGDWSVGANIGTLGFGPEIAYSVSPSLTLRGAGNFLEYDYDTNVDGIDYDLNLDFVSAGAFVDLHPMRNGFHFSLGALYNDNTAGLLATAQNGSVIGGTTVVGGPVGLRGDLSVDEFAPYLGLGWDSTFTSRSNWSFTLRAGVLYQGQPEVTLVQTAGPPVPLIDLEAEANQIEDDLTFLELYPVVSIGLNYRF